MANSEQRVHGYISVGILFNATVKIIVAKVNQSFIHQLVTTIFHDTTMDSKLRSFVSL